MVKAGILFLPVNLDFSYGFLYNYYYNFLYNFQVIIIWACGS